MDAAYRAARSLVLSIKGDLDRLEQSLPGASTGPALKALQQKAAHLGELNQQLQSAQRVRDLSGGQLDTAWRRKVEQVGEETVSLQRAVDLASKRAAAQQEERRALFGGEPPAQAFGSGLSAEQLEGRAVSAIENSKRMLEETLQAGAAALRELGSQRDVLKAAQRKALDMLHSLGLTDSLLKLIDRRHSRDKLVLFGGMLAIVGLLALLVWYKL